MRILRFFGKRGCGRQKGLFYECQCLAFFACTAGATDTMDVILIGRRQVIIDHMAYIRDIYASSGYVSRHENLQMIGF